MPRIPSYDGQQVRQEPIRAPQLPTDAPLDAFGGGRSSAEAFGAAGDVAGGIAEIAARERHKEYQNAVNQQAMVAINQLVKEETRLKLSMQDLSGPDAQVASNALRGDYEKFYQGLTKNIQSDDVKQKVAAHYMNQEPHLEGWAMQAAHAKMQEYDQNEFMAKGKTLVDSVSVDPSMPNVATAVAGRKLDIEDFAKRNNKGPDWVKANQDQASSGIYLTALRSLARSNDYVANQFYAANKGEFLGHDADVAAQLVEASDYRGQAQREVARIFSENKTEKDTYAAVDKIEDAKLQDMVRTRTREKWADIKRIREDGEREDLTVAANIIEGSPSVEAIQKADPTLWDRLPMTAKAALQRRIMQIKKGMGPEAISDKYLSYVREAAVSPEVFVKRNFAAMRDEITADEAQELTKEQASIIKGDERSARKRNGFLTVEEIGKSRLSALGVSDQNDKDMFMTALNRDYWKWRMDPKNAGEQIKPEDAELMVSRLLGRKKAWWQFWGKQTTAVLRNIEDVPEADKAAIQKQLKESGETPTEGRIIEIYNKGK